MASEKTILFINNLVNQITIFLNVLPENLYGKGGPVTVTPRIHNDDFQSIFQQSGRELGYSPVDPSGPLKIGMTIKLTHIWYD